ncbi:hypothetical protein BTA51_22300 [Hahella sp. CCB-MM4]|uniref:hypothetical protein n=1 Tax=Hahella sp. (strain CCB-MM4) TaxID=1926491 RepID=UPI000B9A8830|nr:hypothetical protein [Hahella sp. CCB-MM4]OZG71114.1 hypothetical protein BTA51_22300 [Hahella sp. CCB-MM4]
MDWLDEFYHLSSALTDYKVVQLKGTGVGEEYLDVLSTIIPQDILSELFDCYRSLKVQNSSKPKEQLIRDAILCDAKLGPVARNIIKMWYLSIWYQMPDDWRQQFGKPNQGSPKYQDVQFVVSRNAYIQGLVWEALGSHPMGAKQPGYGTWSDKPTDKGSVISTAS